MGLRTKRTQLALILKCVFVIGIPLTYTIIASLTRQYGLQNENINYHENNPSRRNLLSLEDVLGRNCTPPAIHEFPSDGLTRAQRQHGWAIIHFVIACYCFILLAIVCDDYFVPAIKMMCDKLEMAEDVAGATFMAAASSSPELFINCVGTFITEGDIGVGTIVGSAVFNVLAVPACCGLFAAKVVQLDWWPVSRDSLMYGLAVIMLILVLDDGRVEWYEALILVTAYILYICTMYFNEEISGLANRTLNRCQGKKSYKEITEISPLLKQNYKTDSGSISDIPTTSGNNNESGKLTNLDLEESTDIWNWPGNSCSTCGKIFWVLTWPISFVLFITTPNCRKSPRLVLITFFMCIIWIGTTSYLVAWLITAIGDTLDIPDSVMGLTFLAAGTSVPEAVSSVIVTNQGHGAMGVSNSIGSNTFDILLCLGLPWLIKSSFFPITPGKHWVQINSTGLTYSAISLFSTLVMLYTSFICNKFILDWKIGLTCLLMYVAFLSFASVVEMNVFFQVNLPTCPRKD